MRVSVVATVLNERETVGVLLDSLVDQSRRPDEVVICDGGSRDGTVSVLEEYRGRLPGLKIVRAGGLNISQGRNRAISEATGSVIAVTDAGVRLEACWLERLIAPLANAGPGRESRAAAVAGFFSPEVEGPFQMAMGAAVLPLTAEIDPSRFLPSSRSVAFRKTLWEEVGGYPEWLDYCEDLVFDLRIQALTSAGESAFAWAPQAVAHFRPRTSMAAFCKQYYRYARGDGKADLWRLRHAVRYATYLLLAPALLGHGLWGQQAPWLGWIGLAAGGVAICARPWRRLGTMTKGRPTASLALSALLVPAIRLAGDAAKMAGYPVGLFWRWRNSRRPEIHWRVPPC